MKLMITNIFVLFLVISTKIKANYASPWFIQANPIINVDGESHSVEVHVNQNTNIKGIGDTDDAETRDISTSNPTTKNPDDAETRAISKSNTTTEIPDDAETTAISTSNPTTEIPAECPEADGFFKVPESVNQCFKLFTDSDRSWEAARTVCQDEGLLLAKPEDPVTLRKYVIDTYGLNKRLWIGGRGTGSGTVEWVRDGTILSNNEYAWLLFQTSGRTTTGFCMNLLAEAEWMNYDQTKPNFMEECHVSYHLLCELVIQ